MKLSFSKRERFIFYTLILIFSIYGCYVFGYEFFWQDIQQARRDLMAAQQKFSAKSLLLNRLTSQLEKREGALVQYYQSGSDDSVRSKILVDLQQLSSQDNVQIADMKPLPMKVEEGYKEFPVSMILEGELIDIMRYLYAAESQENSFLIKEFRFSRSFSRASQLRCQVVLSRVFLLKS